MLKKQAPFIFIIAVTMVFFVSQSTTQAFEEEQQEETFKHPIEKLTGSVGDIPVYSHIYGADFMTEAERCSYLLKLDNMKTKQERDSFRAQHRQEIDKKRKEKGG